MARRERSAADQDQEAAHRHSPSSPSRPPVVNLYVYRGEKRCIVGWATFEGAAAFLEYLVKDIEDPTAFKWIKASITRRTGLEWPGTGLRVEAETEAALERVIETETEWVLPENYRRMVTQLWSDKTAEPDSNSSEARAARKAERAERKNEPRAPREKKTPARPEGWLHVSEICGDVAAPHARAALRQLKWEKPAFGWYFDPKRASEVNKAIKGALK